MTIEQNNGILGGNDMDDMVFSFVYRISMRDATLRRAYDGNIKILGDCTQFSESTRALKELVSDVLTGKIESRDEYDKKFLNVAKLLCGDINAVQGNAGHFTFGNAQKLINIMMKYFYVHAYGNTADKKNFRFCHCPMDHQLLEHVWNNCRDNIIMGGEFTTRKEFTASWGHEDFGTRDGRETFPVRYRVFQAAVRKLSDARGVSPIEYDYKVWGNP